MALRDVLMEKRDRILEIAERHGAFNVRVFGSVARGEETPQSDIDFLIDYDIDRVSPWFPVRLVRELESLLDSRVDVVTEDGLKARIRQEVLEEAIKL
jgi:predicted nucleotidyltransferase